MIRTTAAEWPRVVNDAEAPTVSSVPSLITIDFRPGVRRPGREPLCIDELLVLVDEIADLGVPHARFVVPAGEPDEDVLRTIEHAQRRKLHPAVAFDGAFNRCAEQPLLCAIAEAGASAIAVPLHSHNAAIHRSVGGPDARWSQSIRLASLVRDCGVPLEIETRITHANALPLFPLMEMIEAMHGAQWRLDFRGSNAGDTVATTMSIVILHAAASGRLRIIVHDFPQLAAVLTTRCGLFRTPDLANLTIINAGEAMRVSRCGDIAFDDREPRHAGNIRSQPIDFLFRSGTAKSAPAAAVYAMA